jgi:hypothetical protein
MTTEQASYTGASTMSDPGSASTGDSGDRLQDAAGSIASRVSGTAQTEIGSRADTQLAKAGDVLGQVAAAIRQGGEQLRTDQPQVAGFADAAAGQVERASEFVRHTDLNGLVQEAEDFARRQPALFLGGALVLGLAASRFLKASPRDDGSTTRSGQGAYGTGYGRTGAASGNGHYGVAERESLSTSSYQGTFDASSARPTMGSTSDETLADASDEHGRA